MQQIAGRILLEKICIHFSVSRLWMVTNHATRSTNTTRVYYNVLMFLSIIYIYVMNMSVCHFVMVSLNLTYLHCLNISSMYII